jgi:type I restriction enzyme S subunit
MKFLDYIQVNPTIKLEKDKQYPFVEMANADVFAREPKQIDIKKYSSGVKFQRGDTVIARIEPCLQNGKGFFVKNISEGFGSTEFLVFRPKDDKVTNEFLYYFMLTDYIRKSMINSMTGATGRQRVNKDIFKSLELSLPSIEKQKRIADILSAYDDLIENNQKQIKLLEEAAMRLYKEWFVKLRFPGHENTKIVDGVPEGWERNKLIEIADIQYGFAFDSSKFNILKKGTPIIRIRNIPSGNTSDYTTEHADEQYLAYNGDIIVGMDGEFHINTWAGDTAYLVQRTCRIKPKNTIMKGYLLQAIYEPIKYFEKTITGATVAHLGKKHIDTITLLTAPEKYYLPFQYLFDKRQILLKQNVLLQEARDKLLPKLMSGEIEV